MKFVSYLEYSPKGIDWLSNAPSHWTSVPIKYVALEQKSLFLDGDWIESKDLADVGIRYLTTGNVGEGRFKEQGAGFVSDEKFKELKCTEVFPDDMLISRLNRPIGRSCIVPDLGFRIITSVDNVIVRADGQYVRPFLVYLFSSKDYFRHTNNLARGTTMHRISRSLLGNIRILIPPQPEQTQIAMFLDYETAKIDTLIEKQQQLIALLKEKRQAVISQAVTKGLNPDAPMRDSGVECLGEIPAHWEVSRLGYIATVDNGSTPSRSVPEYWGKNDGNGVGWLNSSKINDDEVYVAEQFISERAVRECHLPLCKPNGVLVAITGEGQTRGRAALLKIPATINQHLAYLDPDHHRIDACFLWRQLQAQYYWLRFESAGGGSTRAALTCEFLRNVPITLPPLFEQKQLIKGMGKVVEQMDRIADKAQLSLDLLQERRTALISAAVTGKIDVRNWSVPSSKTEAELA